MESIRRTYSVVIGGGGGSAGRDCYIVAGSSNMCWKCSLDRTVYTDERFYSYFGTLSDSDIIGITHATASRNWCFELGSYIELNASEAEQYMTSRLASHNPEK